MREDLEGRRRTRYQSLYREKKDLTKLEGKGGGFFPYGIGGTTIEKKKE